MRYYTTITCFMIAVLTVSGPGTLAQADVGRQLVEQKCSACHATGEDGVSSNPNAPTFRSLYRRYPVGALRESFLKGLQVGHRNMPMFKLTPQETTNIITYLQDLNPCARASSDKAAMAKCFAPMK